MAVASLAEQEALDMSESARMDEACNCVGQWQHVRRVTRHGGTPPAPVRLRRATLLPAAAPVRPTLISSEMKGSGSDGAAPWPPPRRHDPGGTSTLADVSRPCCFGVSRDLADAKRFGALYFYLHPLFRR